MKSKGLFFSPMFFFLPGMIASTIFSSAIWSAISYFSSSFDCLVTRSEASTRSLTIESTSLPTYPTSVNLVASTFTKGASMSLARRLAISVLPQPVGPIIRMFFGVISSLSSSVRRDLLYLFLRAMATDFLASFCPMIYLSSSETISLGVILYNLLAIDLASFVFKLQNGDIVVCIYADRACDLKRFPYDLISLHVRVVIQSIGC